MYEIDFLLLRRTLEPTFTTFTTGTTLCTPITYTIISLSKQQETHQIDETDML